MNMNDQDDDNRDVYEVQDEIKSSPVDPQENEHIEINGKSKKEKTENNTIMDESDPLMLEPAFNKTADRDDRESNNDDRSNVNKSDNMHNTQNNRMKMIHLHYILEVDTNGMGWTIIVKTKEQIINHKDNQISILELDKYKLNSSYYKTYSHSNFTVHSIIDGQTQEITRSYAQFQRLRKNLIADMPFSIFPHLPVLKDDLKTNAENMQKYLIKLLISPKIVQGHPKTLYNTSFKDFLNPNKFIVEVS